MAELDDILNENKPKNIRPKKGTYYVDPKEFQNQILIFYKTNIITDEIGTAINNIASRLAFAPNFINYSYREDMVGDAIIKMFNALKNKKFCQTKGNPFSYFTMIAFNAFCNRIKKEKKSHEAIMSYKTEVYERLMDSGHIPHTNIEELLNPSEDNSSSS